MANNRYDNTWDYGSGNVNAAADINKLGNGSQGGLNVLGLLGPLGKIAGPALSALSGFFMNREQTGFDKNIMRDYLAAVQPYIESLQGEGGDWAQRQFGPGGLYERGNQLLSQYLNGMGGGASWSQMPDFSMLDKSGRMLQDLNGGVYQGFRDAVGEGQRLQQQAATGGLPGQMLATRQYQEQLGRMGAQPGVSPAQRAFMQAQMAQNNSLNTAQQREQNYAGATQALMGAQGNLGQAQLSGVSSAGQLGASRAGIEEAARRRQLDASTMPLQAMSFLSHLNSPNPYTMAQMPFWQQGAGGSIQNKNAPNYWGAGLSALGGAAATWAGDKYGPKKQG